MKQSNEEEQLAERGLAACKTLASKNEVLSASKQAYKRQVTLEILFSGPPTKLQHLAARFRAAVDPLTAQSTRAPLSSCENLRDTAQIHSRPPSTRPI